MYASDQELMALFDVESIEDLEAMANKVKRNVLEIPVCEGSWMKYERSSTWVMNREPEE